MALRGHMVTSDGKTRVHSVQVDGVEKIRIERLGRTQALSGRDRPCWYHVHDAGNVQEVARHVDLSDLKPGA